MAHAALTARDAEVYDRQIRLWGVEGQKRLQAAHVCVVGLGALGVEVAKNLILAGVQTTVVDDAPVTLDAVGVQFFLRDSHVGTAVRWGCARGEGGGGGEIGHLPWCPRALAQRSAACIRSLRDLNPLVAVHCGVGTAASLAGAAGTSDGGSSASWGQFRCVVVTDGAPHEQVSRTRAGNARRGALVTPPPPPLPSSARLPPSKSLLSCHGGRAAPFASRR
jgi:hypothetical protein